MVWLLVWLAWNYNWIVFKFACVLLSRYTFTFEIQWSVQVLICRFINLRWYLSRKIFAKSLLELICASRIVHSSYFPRSTLVRLWSLTSVCLGEVIRFSLIGSYTSCIVNACGCFSLSLANTTPYIKVRSVQIANFFSVFFAFLIPRACILIMRAIIWSNAL